jgi:FkbM family methyltransferase
MDAVSLAPKWARRLADSFLRGRGWAPSFDRTKVSEIWVDVGAHLGQGTLDAALSNSHLLVFAFEPNWILASKLMARAANFVVLPMAVSDTDGYAEFFVNSRDDASSLATMDETGRRHWKDVNLDVKSSTVVQTVRLDTFMGQCQLPRVDYLKIDAEGVDLKVVQSAGEKLRSIGKIQLEVDVSPDRLYHGAPSREEVIDYMSGNGFKLIATESQNNGRQENLTFLQPQAGGVHP